MKYRCTLVALTAFVPIAGIGRDLEDSLVESPFWKLGRLCVDVDSLALFCQYVIIVDC